MLPTETRHGNSGSDPDRLSASETMQCVAARGSKRSTVSCPNNVRGRKGIFGAYRDIARAALYTFARATCQGYVKQT